MDNQNRNMMENLLEHMNGIIFETEVAVDGTVRVTFASSGLFSVMRRDPNQVGAHGENIWSVVLPEDVKPLQAAIRDATRAKAPLNYIFRVYGAGGETGWRKIQSMPLPGEGGGTGMLHIVTDITEQKRTEDALLERNRILDFALRNTDINLWYFNLETKECALGENCQKAHEMPGVDLLENFPECLIEIGYVREDCVKTIRQAYRQLWETGESLEFDVWFRRADGSGWWCERDMITAVLGPDGKVMRGIGVGKDVTAEKKLEEKYRAFQSYRALAEKDVVASFYLNLTTDWTSGCVNGNEIVSKTYPESGLDRFFNTVLEHMNVPEDRQRCRALFSRRFMLNFFARGGC